MEEKKMLKTLFDQDSDTVSTNKGKQRKLTSEQELYNRYLERMGREEILLRSMQAAQIRKSPLYVQPPKNADESKYFGWLRGMALEIETLASGKWFYWLSILGKGEYEGEEIPQSRLANDIMGSLGYKMLEKCVEICKQEGYGIEHFLEWVGFGIGLAWFKRPSISDRLWKRLYQTFCLDILLLEPRDYFSYLLTCHGFSGWLEYYPTPSHVSSAMVMMINADNDDSTRSVYEPTVGVGSILLHANSLNLVGTDLNPYMIKAASIQAFMYAPWLLFTPSPVIGLHFSKEEQRMNKYFEFDSDTRLYCGDALLGEFRAPRHIFEEGSELVNVYISPLDVSKRAIFQFEEEMQQEWDTLPAKTRMEIIKACCREMGFDTTLSNPPFGKLPAMCRENIKTIQENNQKLLAEREERLKKSNSKPHPLVAKAVEEIDSKMEQIEVKLDEKSGMYYLAI